MRVSLMQHDPQGLCLTPLRSDLGPVFLSVVIHTGVEKKREERREGGAEREGEGQRDFSHVRSFSPLSGKWVWKSSEG